MGFAAGYGLFLFFKVQARLCLSGGFLKGALFYKFLLFGESCLCFVQFVGCLF